MKQFLFLFVAAGLVALPASAVSADDLNYPPWWDDPIPEGATAQWFEFDTDPADRWNIPAEAAMNPYGDPCAWVPADPPAAYWMAAYAGPGGSEDGVWKLGAEGMYFEIDNTENTELETLKHIWMQATYDAGG